MTHAHFYFHLDDINFLNKYGRTSHIRYFNIRDVFLGSGRGVSATGYSPYLNLFSYGGLAMYSICGTLGLEEVLYPM